MFDKLNELPMSLDIIMYRAHSAGATKLGVCGGEELTFMNPNDFECKESNIFSVSSYHDCTPLNSTTTKNSTGG